MNFVTPSGFRDVLPEEASAREAAARLVQDCFAAHGCVPIETPTLEVLDVMRAGGHVPGSPFRLFDAGGDLLAMRPDVTMQVARMCGTRLAGEPGPFRFRYMQRVFREADGALQAEPREMTQMGVECVGEEGPEADAAVIELFAEALDLLGVRGFTLSVATVGVLSALLEASGASDAWKSDVLAAYHASNFVELDRLTEPGEGLDAARSGVSEAFACAIRDLARIRGGADAVAQVRALVEPLGCEDGLDAFEAVVAELERAGLADRLLVDFSIVSSFDYYTGVVFEAYAPGVGAPLGSGGRYDNLLGTYGESRPSAGFAFFLEQAMYAAARAAADGSGERPLRIAVPKGSLNPDSIAVLEAAGLDVTGLSDPGRALIVRNPGVEYVIVRPSDAPVFVALGAADCGICGKDSLLEAGCDVVELSDLKFGACRFIVAEPAWAAGAAEERLRRVGSIRIATKYPRITRWHYDRQGVQVEIVKLHGNIELAPLTGLAERIVDITATGTTLRENDLVIVDEVLSSTARFFANACSFRTDPRIVDLARRLRDHARTAEYEPIAGAVSRPAPVTDQTVSERK